MNDFSSKTNSHYATQTRFCPNCGTEGAADKNFCEKCGYAMGGSTNNAFDMKQGSEFNDADRNGIFQNDYFTFIGKNQSYYLQKFDQISSAKSNNSWNWAAFFFSIYWVAYRKMYKNTAILSIVFIISSIITINGNRALGSIISMGMSIYTGICGNKLYKDYVDREIQMVMNCDEPQKQRVFREKGGVSIISLIIAIIVMVIIISRMGM